VTGGTKIVGVIGGLGPAATHDFFGRIISKTKALRDQDHLRLIIDNNTKIPDRNAALRRHDPEPGIALAATARGLEVAGADLIVMPCNTAHAYEAEIRAAITVPFISMIAETVADTLALAPRPKRVGLLAADGCLAAGLYQSALKAEGAAPVTLDAEAQARFMDVVYQIKSGEIGEAQRAAMFSLAETLSAAGAQAVIAGCTEVPIVLSQDDVFMPLVSSTDVLVARTILAAGGALR
jgi:aspartate racemase